MTQYEAKPWVSRCLRNRFAHCTSTWINQSDGNVTLCGIIAVIGCVIYTNIKQYRVLLIALDRSYGRKVCVGINRGCSFTMLG